MNSGTKSRKTVFPVSIVNQDPSDFCARMRLKWYFWDETQEFNETQAFLAKSSWNLPEGHPCLELLFCQVEHKLFEVTKQGLRYSNLSKEEWEAIRSLADDRFIVIKKADKSSCVVAWERNDYVLEAEKQLTEKRLSRCK